LAVRPELATGRRTLEDMTMSVARSMIDSTAPRSRAQDIDRHVGARMRERRILLGLTQLQLAELIDVTYQQAHKYEKGVNRIAAGRLSGIAQALRVPIGYFYDGLTTTAGAGKARGAVKASLQQRRMAELARHFMALPSRKHQEAICALARCLANRDLTNDLELDTAIEDQATAA
jgi:transcriptional regulator with XRE-family HTH domain